MAVKKYDITVGDLRKTVLFQQSVAVDNNSGGQPITYTGFVATRCKISNTSGNKYLDTGQIVYQNSWEMITRFRSDLFAGVNTDTRCIIDNQIYRINSWNLTDMTKHFLIFELSQADPGLPIE